MSDQPHRPVFFWLVLLTCVVYAGLFAFTIYAVSRYYGVEKAPGWVLRAEGTGFFVSEVDDAGPAAGRIQLGDRLLAINGDERRAVIGWFQWVFVDGGHTYRVDLDRRGERVSLDLPMPLIPGQQLTPIFALVGLAFFICGATLSLLRPHDPQVRLAGAFLMSVGFVTILLTLQGVFSFLVGWERKVHYVVVPLSLWTLPLAYHFFSRFPVWRSPGPVWRTIQWLLYAVFVLVIWPSFGIIIYLGLGVSEGATSFMVAHPSLYLTACQITFRPLFIYIIVCFLLSLVVTARNYQRLCDPGSRRRIRLVVAGMTVAVVPFVGLTFAFNVAEWGSPRTYSIYSPLSFLAMLCIPVSIGAAVWKEQLFDIRVLVRRGLQYLFAKVALRALLALPIALLVFSILLNPNRTIVQILTQGSGWLNVVWIGAAAAALYWRRRLQAWLDRRFFREDYQQEQVLGRLIDEVKQRDSLAEIAQLVTARIDSVLHPAALHVFYRERGDSDFVSGRSASPPSSHQELSAQQTLARVMDAAPTQQHLSQQQALLRMLEGSKAILGFPYDLGDLPEDERSWLENLGVRLIVPITGTRDRLVGVLLLGGRMSDEPYSTTDRRLLEGIAAQIGLVYENQHLRERVRLEADVRRDVLGRLEDGASAC
jgi:GAF domain-containing protein